MRRLSYICVLAVAMIGKSLYATEHAKQPNILFVISDDQSYPHASAYGSRGKFQRQDLIKSREKVFWSITLSPDLRGVRALACDGSDRPIPLAEPTCYPCTSSFPAELDVYPELLSKHGYHVGYTGKPWGREMECDRTKAKPSRSSFFFSQRKATGGCN